MPKAVSVIAPIKLHAYIIAYSDCKALLFSPQNAPPTMPLGLSALLQTISPRAPLFEAGTISTMTPTVARELAMIIHRDHTDKAVQPYIAHCARVAAEISRVFGPEHPAVAVAWLHDVLETASDAAAVEEWLRSYSITDDQLSALRCLTRTSGESRAEHINKARSHTWSVFIKRAEIADNTNPTRLSLLDKTLAQHLVEKYASDLELLAPA